MEPIERHCDVAVVGGSAAGLAGALQLGRQRRSVIVVDSGEPRNAPAAQMHSYLGHEGRPPAAFLGIARDEVRSYGGEILTDEVVEVKITGEDLFRVELASGHSLIARRVLAATGLVDRLPEIDGLGEHWGEDVIHCPFCHGFEVRDKRIVQIVTHSMGLHPAGLFRQLSKRLTLVLHEAVDADEPGLELLRAAGVAIFTDRVSRVATGEDGRVSAVELEDGERIDADAVVVGPRFEVRADAFSTLGLRLVDHPSGLGRVVETGPDGETSVPGLYAAGNLTDPSQQVLQAAADGSRVGGMISFSLAHEDLEDISRPPANQVDWEHRYSSEPVWSGNPNGALVTEVGAMQPGRVLDVGAGEGGDSIWLAQRGWDVLATDVSANALERVSAAAEQLDLQVDCLRGDVGGVDPYDRRAFDLVSAQYLPVSRAPDDRGVRNLVEAVAPGGTLLVVNHDTADMRRAVDEYGRHFPFDPDAYARTDDFVAVLDAFSDWVVEVHERRPREGGHGPEGVHDIVLRARRLAD